MVKSINWDPLRLSVPVQATMSLATFILLLTLGGTCHCSLCPQTWIQYGNSCYAYIKYSYTWADAASLCRTLGGYLVEITSASENNFVRSLIGRNKAWLGLNDIVQDGRWVLTTTGRHLLYTNWKTGEPNNHQGMEAFALMDTDGHWQDYGKTYETPSVCERAFKNPPVTCL